MYNGEINLNVPFISV